MQSPKAILFDLGDTILGNQHFDPVKGNARLLQFTERPHSISTEEVQHVAQELDAQLNPLREESLLEFTVESFNRLLFERLGVRLTLTSAQAASEFWDASISYSPEPGIGDVLHYLMDRGIPRGIISNSMFSGAVLETELNKHGLRSMFDFLLSSADYGIRKPHPLLFELALHRLGLEAQSVWFVGDKLETDIAGAKKVGLYAVWYNRHRLSHQMIVPDVEVPDWSEFIHLLQAL
jgi:putative hydrolase of the HAD superfamily